MLKCYIFKLHFFINRSPLYDKNQKKNNLITNEIFIPGSPKKAQQNDNFFKIKKKVKCININNSFHK